jgi:hypothetical protein
MKSAMRYLLSSLLAVGLLLAATAHGQEKEKDKKDKEKEKDPTKETTTEYYPLKEGTTWTYKAGDKEFTVTVAGTEKRGEPPVSCYKLETKNSKKDLIASEYVAVKEDGVYRYGFEKSDAKPPLRFLKLPIKSGEKKWSIDSKVGGKEVKGSFSLNEEKDPVKVPAGEYKNVVSVTSEGLQIDDQKVPITYYFAPKVGVVKQTVEVGGTKVTLELVKVEEKK